MIAILFDTGIDEPSIGMSPRDLLPKGLILLPAATRRIRTRSLTTNHPEPQGRKQSHVENLAGCRPNILFASAISSWESEAR